MLENIAIVVVVTVISFFLGARSGKKDEQKRQAQNVVDDYRKGEKEDAKPDLNNGALRNWFNRVLK